MTCALLTWHGITCRESGAQGLRSGMKVAQPGVTQKSNDDWRYGRQTADEDRAQTRHLLLLIFLFVLLFIALDELLQLIVLRHRLFLLLLLQGLQHPAQRWLR